MLGLPREGPDGVSPHGVPRHPDCRTRDQGILDARTGPRGERPPLTGGVRGSHLVHLIDQLVAVRDPPVDDSLGQTGDRIFMASWLVQRSGSITRAASQKLEIRTKRVI